MGLVMLRAQRDNGTETHVYVNPDRVTYVEDLSRPGYYPRCKVHFTGDSSTTVLGDIDKVAVQLAGYENAEP